ncbi:MAG: hypothetical protein DHS20C18_29410 [Saprospiraceae bacterium]|nr:MAG: hypothetical protein DHS20C18_29410 [Saprospiraceae bacterium]
MLKYKHLIIALLLVSLCYCEKSDRLAQFFTTLESKISEKELNDFRMTRADSVPDMFENFSVEYQEAFNEEFPIEDDISDFKESLEGNNFRDEMLFMIYKFHDWLNGQEHSIEEYEEIIRNYHQLKLDREQKEEEKQKRELLKVILKNEERWRIGDTLGLVFSLEKRYYGKAATERIFPYNMEIYEFEDKFRMQGVLLEKQLDSFDLKFVLKVTEVSADSIYVWTSKNRIIVGDIFELPLQKYARPIE